MPINRLLTLSSDSLSGKNPGITVLVLTNLMATCFFNLSPLIQFIVLFSPIHTCTLEFLSWVCYSKEILNNPTFLPSGKAGSSTHACQRICQHLKFLCLVGDGMYNQRVAVSGSILCIWPHVSQSVKVVNAVMIEGNVNKWAPQLGTL